MLFSSRRCLLPRLLPRHRRLEINLLNYCTINPFFTAKDIIISFRACSCIIDYFILLSQYGEVKYFTLSTGARGEVRVFNGAHIRGGRGWGRARRGWLFCKWQKHLGAVRESSDVYMQQTYIPFRAVGRRVYFVFAILRQLTDNEKKVLLQTCDQLKPH